MESGFNKPDVSIIIPVHNGGEKFQRCLKSLEVAGDRQSAGDYQIEVIVVADGESDGSWRQAQAAGATVIRLPFSKGPANARNVGARAASADILFFIDADVTVHSDTVGKVLDTFARSPTVSALIGSYDDAPGASNFLSQYKNLFHHYTHQQGSKEASTFWGACGAVRRDVFWSVGGFDQSYRRPCIEDIELGYRLRQAGHRIALQKDIQVKHLKDWRCLSLLRAEIFYRALPWTALLMRLKANHPEDYQRFTQDLNLQFSSQVSVVLTFTLVAAAVMGPFWQSGYALASLSACGLLLLNLPVYRFFAHKRGILFALRVVPWHWFYYLYAGACFAVGLVRHNLVELRVLPRLTAAFKPHSS